MKDTAEYHRQKRWSRFLAMLIVIDIGMATGIVCFWSTVAPYLVEPVGWATSRNIPPRPELFDYPVELVWLIPLLCGGLAWLAVKLRLRSLARILAAFPLLLLALVDGWFLFAPLAWR
jgi:hypothetical protein